MISDVSKRSAGALVVSKLGAQPSMPTWRDVEKFKGSSP